MVLLDTHIWVWLNQGGGGVSDATRSHVAEAAGRGEAWVSVISVWEVALLEAKGRIGLTLPLSEWVTRALAPPLRLAPLTPEIAVESGRLPPPFHSDPADRILTATARLEGLTLVTRDRRILAYAAQAHVTAVLG